MQLAVQAQSLSLLLLLENVVLPIVNMSVVIQTGQLGSCSARA